MTRTLAAAGLFAITIVGTAFAVHDRAGPAPAGGAAGARGLTVHQPSAMDVSPPLADLAGAVLRGVAASGRSEILPARAPLAAARRADGAAVEQTSPGTRPPAVLLESFDGQGYGQVGPHGSGAGNNPSDNSLAVGPNHVVETVNTRLAVYTKKGELYDRSGELLFGPIGTNVLFSGFGGECEARPNGDAVVRYDQLAERWFYVMPLFRRAATVPPGDTIAPYGMCYALSTGPNPLGPYYRYYFVRELFPDYPRPAIWPDGYYIPTSTGDNLLPDGRLPEKHACVLERSKVLAGLPAREQCVIVTEANFLNNADIDGWGLPPAGAPNIMMATGGTQLREDYDDDGIYVWKFQVDWEDSTRTRVTGPVKIAVEPYHYLCDGQLTRCVPQPGTDMRLDAQGDKIMQRLVYRNIDGVESIVAVHSVNTAAGGGGVRWYEFRLDANRDPMLHQQGTYAPDGFYRWMASPGIDRQGNIGIGYSFGGTPHYAGQRFAGRLAGDPPGLLTLRETVLVEGQAAQTNTLRWEDYTQLSLDPVDDCTMWYVGDYLKAGAPSYTTRIGAFRLPGCLSGTVSGTAYFDVNRNGVREPNEPGLAGWRVTYSGVRGWQDRVDPPSDSLTTDAAGDFRASLPADPAYFAPTYTFTARASAHPAWSRSMRGNAYASGGPVPMTNGAYVIELRDRDDVAHVSFGNACTVTNAGGQASGWWAGNAGRAVLAANDQQPAEPGGRGGRGGGRGRGGAPAGWRNLLNTQFLIDAEGNRVVVGPGPFDEAWAPVRAWLTASSPDAWHRLSTQIAAAALNVAYGRQDANVTVRDPVVNDWPTVGALLGRAGARVQARLRDAATEAPESEATAYGAALAALNANTANVTPVTPAGCPQPF